MIYLKALPKLSGYAVSNRVSRVRETGKNMGENSCKEFEVGGPVFVRTGRRLARRTSETLTESTEFKL